MRFMIEVRPVVFGGAGVAAMPLGHVVDGEELFEHGYERVLRLVVRSLTPQVELAMAEHEWIWGDHDE